MTSLVILGAAGFLGKTIIKCASNERLPIKAIVRKKTTETAINNEGVSWHELDLLTPGTLDKVIEMGDIVINTVYIPTDNKKDNLLLIDNVLTSCIKKKAKRIIHCSTADVVGTVKDINIDESTICNPLTPYEQVKFDIEQHITNSPLENIETIIVRPSAIVGAGGKNLAKLAGSLMHGNKLVNYLRASVFRKRKMHLVSAHNVAAAILHLSSLQNVLSGSTYFISSDDDPDNNFLSIEKILLQALGLKNRKIPLLPIPSFFLSTLLVLKKRSGVNLARTYKSKKLLNTNFTPIDSLHNAVSQFAKEYLRART